MFYPFLRVYVHLDKLVAASEQMRRRRDTAVKDFPFATSSKRLGINKGVTTLG